MNIPDDLCDRLKRLEEALARSGPVRERLAGIERRMFRVEENASNALSLVRSLDRKARTTMKELFDRVGTLEGKMSGAIVDDPEPAGYQALKKAVEISDEVAEIVKPHENKRDYGAQYCCKVFESYIKDGTFESIRGGEQYAILLEDEPGTRRCKIGYCPFCGRRL